jgi:hypothetical protein
VCGGFVVGRKYAACTLGVGVHSWPPTVQNSSSVTWRDWNSNPSSLFIWSVRDGYEWEGRQPIQEDLSPKNSHHSQHTRDVCLATQICVLSNIFVVFISVLHASLMQL